MFDIELCIDMLASVVRDIELAIHLMIALLKPQTDGTPPYAIESVASMVTYILALLLCVTKLTIYILLCINARTLHNLIDYTLLVL